MLSNVWDKEQSTNLKTESFTTNFIKNNYVQLINEQVSNESPYKSPLVKRIFALKQKKIRESPSHHFFVIKTIT